MTKKKFNKGNSNHYYELLGPLYDFVQKRSEFFSHVLT